MNKKQWYKDNRERCIKMSKEYYDAYKEDIIEIMKQLKINGCAICGYTKCNRALEFHHVLKNKCFYLTVSNIRKYKDEKIINELNKCILLCANCYREIHDREE